MLSRRTVLLKPMQPGLSGYARLQTEGGQTLLQLNARGMESGEEAVLYRYTSDRRAQEAAIPFGGKCVAFFDRLIHGYDDSRKHARWQGKPIWHVAYMVR